MEIRIRRVVPEDFEAIWHILGEDAVYAGTLQPPHPSREVWRKRIAELPETDYMLVACLDGKVVGQAALHSAGKSPRRAHAMMVALVISTEWSGRGVGSALMKELLAIADGWLNVIRLELTVFADNAAAIAVYRKFGFEVEGTHKAYALRAGEYVDALAMARVRAKKPPVASAP